jgi:hypothetical protein
MEPWSLFGCWSYGRVGVQLHNVVQRLTPGLASLDIGDEVQVTPYNTHLDDMDIFSIETKKRHFGLGLMLNECKVSMTKIFALLAPFFFSSSHPCLSPLQWVLVRTTTRTIFNVTCHNHGAPRC